MSKLGFLLGVCVGGIALHALKSKLEEDADLCYDGCFDDDDYDDDEDEDDE